MYRFMDSLIHAIMDAWPSCITFMNVRPYNIVLYHEWIKIMDFLRMSGELFGFHVSVSLISFLATNRTGISQHFQTFPIFDFVRIQTLHGCRMYDSRADSRAEAGSKPESEGTPTHRFASAVDKNTLSFAIFFQTQQGKIPYLLLQSIFFLV